MLKNLLLLSGFSTFVVIIIVGLDVYHNYKMSSLPKTTQQKIVPIAPSFDKKTLDELKKRTPIVVSLDEKSSVVSEDSKSTLNTGPAPSPTTTQSIATSSGSIIQETPSSL